MKENNFIQVWNDKVRTTESTPCFCQKCLQLEAENKELREKLTKYEGQTHFYCQCGGLDEEKKQLREKLVYYEQDTLSKEDFDLIVNSPPEYNENLKEAMSRPLQFEKEINNETRYREALEKFCNFADSVSGTTVTKESMKKYAEIKEIAKQALGGE